MKRTLLLIMTLFGLLTGCKSADDNIPRLEIETAIDNPRELNLNEIADEIRFIPLDGTVQESLIGNIRSIDETANRFYVSDNATEPIRVFDKTGKFVGTRGVIGRGPDEFAIIGAMTADYSQDNIYMSGYMGGSVVVGADTSGRIFARLDSADNRQISFHDGKLFLLRDTPSRLVKMGETITLFDIYSSGLDREISVEVPFIGNSTGMIGSQDTGFFGRVMGHFLSNNDDRLLVKRGRNDTVFVFFDGMLEPAYKFDLGKYTPPAEMFEGLTRQEQWESYYSMDGMYEGDSYVIIRARGGMFGEVKYLVFDRGYLSDGFLAVGPDGTPGIFIDGIAFTPMYVRDNRLVGYMQAIDILDNASTITDPELKNLTTTMKEDSNPVIVIAKFKK